MDDTIEINANIVNLILWWGNPYMYIWFIQTVVTFTKRKLIWIYIWLFNKGMKSNNNWRRSKHVTKHVGQFNICVFVIISKSLHLYSINSIN